MKASNYVLFSIILSIVFCGCAPKIMVPPKIDLLEHEVVGIIEFSSNSVGSMEQYVTQEFIREMTEDQTIRIIELGSEQEIMDELGRSRIGPEEIMAVGKKYSVKTIATGILDFGEPSDKIDLSGGFANMNFSSEVSVMLTVKMRESKTGATIWTDSARDEQEISDVGFWGGYFHFDAENPERAYGKLAERLVKEVTADFRVSWERQKRSR